MLYTSFTVAAIAVVTTHATKLSIKTPNDNIDAAKTLVDNLMGYYDPSDNGVVPMPVNWWESAGLWATMVHYSSYSGDRAFNSDVAAAVAAQAGPNQDFMNTNTLGNDDQLWWGIAAITAAEYDFDNPPTGSSWINLAQNVFDEVSERWDSSSCSGGLHWQISPSAQGYHYKNAISNGLLFQLAARLARYTGDSQYSDWATKVFAWVQSVGLVDEKTYAVFDGTDDRIQCSQLDHDEWSYNVGVFLYGAAVMLDHTKDSNHWRPHVDGFVSAAIAGFTANGIVQETMCEPSGTCNTDQLSFKAYLIRWLATTVAMVPSTSDKILPVLQASAAGALETCNAGPGSQVCGTRWTESTFDGAPGFGQQMAALEVIQGLLAPSRPLPQAAAVKRGVPVAFTA